RSSNGVRGSKTKDWPSALKTASYASILSNLSNRPSTNSDFTCPCGDLIVSVHSLFLASSRAIMNIPSPDESIDLSPDKLKMHFLAPDCDISLSSERKAPWSENII